MAHRPAASRPKTLLVQDDGRAGRADDPSVPDGGPRPSETKGGPTEALSGREWEARHAPLLGQKTHQVVALLCERGVTATAGYGTMMNVLAAVNHVCADVGTSHARERALRQGVATASCVYLRRFKPDDGWEWISAETSLPGARLDLVFQRRDDGTVLVDELKTGSNRTAGNAARAQVARHLRAAGDRWTDRFAGVRLLWLTAPASSQFFPTATATPVALSSSAYAETC